MQRNSSFFAMTFLPALVLGAPLISAPLAARDMVSAGPAAARPIADTPITEAELAADMRILASDAFEGRAPASTGEARTLAHMIGTWSRAGFEPLAGSITPWLQPVPLVDIAQRDGEMQFFVGSQRLNLSSADMVMRTSQPEFSVQKSPLLYVGYGVDGDGNLNADVTGKLILILSGDAPYLGKGASLRDRRALLTKAGAAGVIAVAAPDMPWPYAQRGFAMPLTQLDEGRNGAAFDALMSLRAFDQLAQKLGRKGADLRAAANAANFQPQPSTLTVTIKASAHVRPFVSHNIVARLAGARPDGKAVLLMGHWDHLGICQPDDAKDRICNGAVDNASGLAVMNAVAKRLASGPRPDRDIYLLATTAEEMGLLGAQYFVNHPPLPLSDIIVALNLDTVAIAPRGSPVAVVGRGRPAHDQMVAKVVQAAGRVMDHDNEADEFLRRQDGWAFTLKNVPALMVGGSFSDMGLLESFMNGDYHGAQDEMSDALPLGGAADDGDLHVQLVRSFASRSEWDSTEGRDEAPRD